jgi:hypothetical protein
MTKLSHKNKVRVLRSSDWVVQMRAMNPNVAELWEGKHSSTGLECRIQYEYDSNVASWLFITQAQG